MDILGMIEGVYWGPVGLLNTPDRYPRILRIQWIPKEIMYGYFLDTAKRDHTKTVVPKNRGVGYS